MVLMSHTTLYEIQRDARDWWAYTKESATGVRIMGLDVMTITWMPDGLVVVTDAYVDPAAGGLLDVLDFKDYYESVYKTVSKSLWDKATISADFSTAVKIPASWFSTSAVASGTYTTTGTTMYYGHDPAVEKPVDEQPVDGTWADTIVEYDPDPESIYGKALARARART